MSKALSHLLCGGVLMLGAGLPSVALAATQCINPGAPAPLEVCVYDDATPAVYVAQPNGRQYQYYSEDAWGSIVWLNGADATQRHRSGYFAGTLFTGVSNDLTGSGTAQDPYVITTIVELGTSGVRLTQRFAYVNGDRTIRKTWSFANTTTDTTYNDVRFIHGGDTYFGGFDSARSWWDPELQMVYVTNQNFTNTGLMGFFPHPGTPAARYFSGNYSTVYSQATSGELANTSDSNFLDAGYALQWNRTSLAPAQTWTIEAFETWSAPGPLQVIAPASENVFAGALVQRPFKVHNLTEDSVAVDLSAVSLPAGWSVSLPNGSTLDLNALEVAAVPVDVEVPGDTPAGTSRDIELTATSVTDSNAAATRLTVPELGYTLAPESHFFAGIAVGQSATVTITLTNGAGAAPVDIGQLGASDGLAAPFAITADTCSNTTVNADANCSVEVTYTRTSSAPSADFFSWPITTPVIVSHTIQLASDERHTVDAVASTGGTINPAATEVSHGNTASFTISPNAGYSMGAVEGCAGSLTGNIYTTGPITSACTVTAAFSLNIYAVSASAGTAGGSVSPAAIDVNHGNTGTFTITPANDYSIDAVEGCGGGSLSGNTYTTAAVTGACSIVVQFARNLDTVVVTTSGKGGGGGSIDVLFLLAVLWLLLLWRSRPALRRARPASIYLNETGVQSPMTIRAVEFARVTSLATLAAALCSLPIGAGASDLADGGLHIGARMGAAQGDARAEDVNAGLAAAGINATASFDDHKRSAWQISASYDFTRHFGLAVGYTNLGKIDMRIAGDVADIPETLEAATRLRVHPHSADGYELAMTGRYPLFGNVFVTGRAGALRWESRYRARNIDGQFHSRSSSGTDEIYGLGLDMAMFGRWHVLADFSRYHIDAETIDFMSVGVTFRIH